MSKPPLRHLCLCRRSCSVLCLCCFGCPVRRICGWGRALTYRLYRSCLSTHHQIWNFHLVNALRAAFSRRWRPDLLCREWRPGLFAPLPLLLHLHLSFRVPRPPNLRVGPCTPLASRLSLLSPYLVIQSFHLLNALSRTSTHQIPAPLWLLCASAPACRRHGQILISPVRNSTHKSIPNFLHSAPDSVAHVRAVCAPAAFKPLRFKRSAAGFSPAPYGANSSPS